MGEVLARLDQGEGINDPDNYFSDNSVMTIIIDLETWFKVTAHPFSKGTLWVRYEPGKAKGREDMTNQ